MTTPAGPRFIAYYRVFTDRHERSGLSLDAQQEVVAHHAAAAGGVVVAAFEEVESGRRSNMPQLGLALTECRAQCAVLLIARLDRLARDAPFLLGLEKAGVEFVATDMPHANRFTVGTMAFVVEAEARMNSARIKAALAAAKARGVRLGNPRLPPGNSGTANRAREAWSAQATRRAAEVTPYLEAARRAGAVTLQQIADALTSQGVHTPRGGDRWRPWQVRRVLDRIRDVSPTPEPPPFRPTEPGEAHAWIRPGATFIEEGEAKRITDITDGLVRGVLSTGGFWSWPLTGIMAAADAGRIQQATHSKPQRSPLPGRQRPYHSKASDKSLAEIRSHPLVVQTGGELPYLVLRTLRALHQGDSAESPALRILMLTIDAGAEARGLGRSIASPKRGSRPSRDMGAAQDVQRLIERFDQWLSGNGEMNELNYKVVESFAEAGIQAILYSNLVSNTKRGRPRERFHTVQNVRARLARHWHRYERGSYKLSDAIREVAEQELLHSKQVDAAWRGKDSAPVVLNDGDAENLRMRRESIASAYHHTYSSVMTVEERSMYRTLAAMQLRLTRRSTRRPASEVGHRG